MWRVIKESPLKAVLAIGYLAFALVYVVIGFLPARAGAAEENLTGRVIIPAAGVDQPVMESWLEGRKLYVPDEIAAVYRRGPRKLLMGHSTTAFRNLARAGVGDEVFYEGKKYRIVKRDQLKVEQINMAEVLRNNGEDTLVLMTCAGENDSERIIMLAR